MKIILFSFNAIVVTALCDSSSHIMLANRFTAWAKEAEGFAIDSTIFSKKYHRRVPENPLFWQQRMRNQADLDSTLAFRCTQPVSALYFLLLMSDEPRLLRYACKTTAFKMLTYLPNYKLILGSYWWPAQQQDLPLSTCPKPSSCRVRYISTAITFSGTVFLCE